MPTLIVQFDDNTAVDAYIGSQPQDTTNYNNAYLAFGFAASSQARSLLKFDLSSLLPDYIVNSATLTITLSSFDAGFADDTFSVYRVTKTWNESQVTWNEYSTGNSWTTAGGDLGIEGAWASTQITSPYDDAVFDLADMVQDAISNQSGILNLLIKGTITSGPNNFYLGNSSQVSPYPKLEINYETELAPPPAAEPAAEPAVNLYINEIFTAKDTTISVSGNVQFAGGTAEMTNSNWEINGNLSAGNVIFTTDAFAGSTWTVAGDFNFNGKLTNLLNLAASRRWYLTVLGKGKANYVNVAYSDASGGNEILVKRGIDSERNINWTFSNILSGQKKCPKGLVYVAAEKTKYVQSPGLAYLPKTIQCALQEEKPVKKIGNARATTKLTSIQPKQPVELKKCNLISSAKTSAYIPQKECIQQSKPVKKIGNARATTKLTSIQPKQLTKPKQCKLITATKSNYVQSPSSAYYPGAKCV